MTYRMIVTFDSDSDHAVDSIKVLVASTFPYMVDNVHMTMEKEE